MAARTTTFRRSLIANLTALLIVLGVAITLTQAIFARSSIRNLSGALTSATLAQTEQGLGQFFSPVTGSLGLAVRWGRDFDLVNLPPEGIYGIFAPFLDEVGYISSAILANEDGREIMVLRREDGTFYVRDTDPNRPSGLARVITFAADGSTLSDTMEDIDYTPVQRPWFVGAVEGYKEVQIEMGAGPIYWTEPYTFFTTQEKGITGAKAFEANNKVWVVAFDVLLKDISAFTTSIVVSDGGKVIVTDQVGRVIGLPQDFLTTNSFEREALLLKDTEELGLPIIDDAAIAFGIPDESNPGPPEFAGVAVRYESESVPYWAEINPFQLDNRNLWIAVIVPEQDLIGNLNDQRLYVLGVLALILIAAILRARFLGRRYAEPIEAIAIAADRISKLKLDEPATAKSNVREISRLAAATERMRASLQNLLKLERDLQTARQIQQATFPESLPTLAQTQLAAYSEPAEETGGDSFDLIGLTLGLLGLTQEGQTATEQRIIAEGPAPAALLFLADATGHGVGPALSVTQVRSMIRMGARLGISPIEIAEHMNEQLCQDLSEGRFVTMWLGYLDDATGELWTLSAGQGPLLLYRAATDTFEEIAVDTTPLGIIDPLPDLKKHTLTMQPGDLFIVLSDGIFEAANPADELFGRDRVEATVRRHVNKPAELILEAIRADTKAFMDHEPVRDDQTGIVIKRTR